MHQSTYNLGSSVSHSLEATLQVSLPGPLFFQKVHLCKDYQTHILPFCEYGIPAGEPETLC